MESKIDKKPTKSVTAIQARQKLGELLDRAKLKGERFLINRNGKPIAVIMGVNDYKAMEDLLDTFFEEADPEFQKALLASRKEYENGDFGTENDLWDALK